MGNLNVPAEMRPYITDADFILGRQRGNSGAFSCVSYNGKMYLHMTRKISSDRYETAFLQQLSALGLSVSTQVSNLA